MDVDELVSSDQPAFDQALQPRDRAGRGSSAEQVEALATDMTKRPGESAELLLRSESGAQGTPIVRPDGMVIAGNGRTMAMRQAGDPFWQGQREAIAARAAEFGIDPGQL